MRASLVFYPSALPVRALIKEIITPAQECSRDLTFADRDLSRAYAGYEDALATIPWISAWPMGFSKARVRRSGERLFVCSAENDAIALPLMASQADVASPLLAIEEFSGFGIWDGFEFRLGLAQTLLGTWVGE